VRATDSSGALGVRSNENLNPRAQLPAVKVSTDILAPLQKRFQYKIALDIVLHELEFEHRANPLALAKARIDAEEFFVRIRTELIYIVGCAASQHRLTRHLSTGFGVIASERVKGSPAITAPRSTGRPNRNIVLASRERVHSYRSAISGSTFVARRAGRKHAAIPTVPRTMTTPMNVPGSVGETP